MIARWGVLGLKTALVAAMATTPMMATAQKAAGNSIAGEWDGMIGNLHLVFVFEQTPEDGLKLKLTSPDQGNAVVPVGSVAFDSGKLDVKMKAIGASYVATLSAAGDSLTGTWAQGAANLPLSLHRPGAQPAAFALKPRTIGTVPLEPCRTVDGNTEGLCGTVSVWENRELRHGRHLALKVMVLPALQGGASDAFFPLAGGPGQSAIETYPAMGYTNAIRRDRDVVLVDQRGTGGSARTLTIPGIARPCCGLWAPPMTRRRSRRPSPGWPRVRWRTWWSARAGWPRPSGPRQPGGRSRQARPSARLGWSR